MSENRADRHVNARQYALRLTKGICEQDACLAGRLVAAPPIVDGGKNLVGGRPTIDWQTKSRFGDENVARYRLKRRDSGIGSDFIIAGIHPYLAPILQSDLSRA